VQSAVIPRTNTNVRGDSWLTSFREALENDLGVPKALSVLNMALKDKDLSPAEKLGLITAMDSVLGLKLAESAKELNSAESHPVNVFCEAGSTTDGSEAEIAALVAERSEAKKAKNYKRADEIRNILLAQGITLEDSANGTSWRRIAK
jgi:cysteinyl-tRNA synthetase